MTTPATPDPKEMILGKPYRQYIAEQFPATVGHIPLNQFFDQLERELASAEQALAALERDKAMLNWIQKMRDDCEGHVLSRVFMPVEQPLRERIAVLMEINGEPLPAAPNL